MLCQNAENPEKGPLPPTSLFENEINLVPTYYIFSTSNGTAVSAGVRSAQAGSSGRDDNVVSAPLDTQEVRRNERDSQCRCPALTGCECPCQIVPYDCWCCSFHNLCNLRSLASLLGPSNRQGRARCNKYIIDVDLDMCLWVCSGLVVFCSELVLFAGADGQGLRKVDLYVGRSVLIGNIDGILGAPTAWA